MSTEPAMGPGRAAHRPPPAAGGLPAALSADALRRQWPALWQHLGRQPPPGLYGGLDAAWRAPGRHYHDTRHLGECLALWELAQGLAEHPAEVALALWFHDAIYDPRADDNEPASADWARRALRDAGVQDPVAARVHALVMATRHGERVAQTPDERLLVDIDLAILGSSAARFEQSDGDIRREYAHVPDPAFREGRLRVLQGFLARPRLYQTDWGRERFETQARSNLAAALSRLRGS